MPIVTLPSDLSENIWSLLMKAIFFRMNLYLIFASIHKVKFTKDFKCPLF